jgi:hypothetical protein
MANAFLTDIENIGKHILKGIEAAAPIIQKLSPVINFIPVVGPSIVDAGNIITQLEQGGAQVTPAEIEQIITTISTAAQLKSAASQASQASQAATAPAKVSS